jgi:DNA-binding NtrC family response regulator
MGVKKARLSPEAASALKGYAWPGNARELEHAVERSLIMAEGKDVSLKDLPPELLTGRPAAKKSASKKAAPPRRR